MKYKEFAHNTLNDDAAKIIKIINESNWNVEADMDSKNYVTNNRRHLLKWDIIYSNIYNSFNSGKYQSIRINRGNLWEFVCIYDKELKIIYITTREENLFRIKENASNERNYIKVYSSINGDDINRYNQQLGLFSNEYNQEYIQEELEKLIIQVGQEVKCCKVILFKEDSLGVSGISENILNYNLDVLYSCNLEDYIVASIDDISDTKDDNKDNVPDIPLGIKPKARILKEDKEEEKKVKMAKKIIKHKEKKDE